MPTSPQRAPRRTRRTRLAPDSRYRRGDRDTTARAAHARQSKQWRRALRIAEFDDRTRADIVRHLRRHGDVVAAAAAVGTTHHAVYGLMRWHHEFRTAVECALARGCPAKPVGTCGTAIGYKAARGRCARCRAAHRGLPLSTSPAVRKGSR